MFGPVTEACQGSFGGCSSTPSSPDRHFISSPGLYSFLLPWPPTAFLSEPKSQLDLARFQKYLVDVEPVEIGKPRRKFLQKQHASAGVRPRQLWPGRCESNCIALTDTFRRRALTHIEAAALDTWTKFFCEWCEMELNGSVAYKVHCLWYGSAAPPLAQKTRVCSSRTSLGSLLPRWMVGGGLQAHMNSSRHRSRVNRARQRQQREQAGYGSAREGRQERQKRQKLAPSADPEADNKEKCEEDPAAESQQ